MADGTGISWTDATWNPVRGCSRVSEGCRNCYAERVAARFSGPGQPYEGLARPGRKLDTVTNTYTLKDGARWTGVVRLIPEHLADPLRWRRPRRIFVNSMSDLFHESLTNEQIAAVFGVMAAAPQHTFQVLTKRATRMGEWFEWMESTGDPVSTALREAFCTLNTPDDRNWPALEHAASYERPTAWPLPNVWIGVSVENQDAADERIPELLRTPAAVRFLSCEPLLGDVRLAGSRAYLTSFYEGRPGIDWVIAGCESGAGARTCDVTWLRSLRDQCSSAEVPFFLKQAVEQSSTAQKAWLPGITFGAGSKHKYTSGTRSGKGVVTIAGRGGVIELPYLDGAQHAAFPEVSP